MTFLDRVIIPFKDSRILPKAGIIFGLSFLGLLLSWGANVLRYLLQIFAGSQPTDEMYIPALLCGVILQIVAGFISIPLFLYQQGYFYDAANSLRSLRESRETDALPEHGDIKSRLSLGGIFVTINITLTIPFIFVIVIAVVLLVSSITSSFYGSSPEALSGIVAGTLVIIGFSVLVMLAVQAVIAPAMMYIYIRERKFASIFSFELVREVIIESWWKFLLTGFVLNSASTLIIWLIALIAIMTCCFIPLLPLVQPAILTAAFLLRLGVYGEIYSSLDETFKGTDLFERE